MTKGAPSQTTGAWRRALTDEEREEILRLEAKLVELHTEASEASHARSIIMNRANGRLVRDQARKFREQDKGE